MYDIFFIFRLSSKKYLSCDVCDKDFLTKTEFLNHHFTHYEQTFKCCDCGSEFDRAFLLHQHLAIHRNEVLEIDLCSDEEEEEEEEEMMDDQDFDVGNEVGHEIVVENHHMSLDVDEDGEELDPINFVELKEEYDEVESNTYLNNIHFTKSRARNNKLIRDPTSTRVCPPNTSRCLYIEASEQIQMPHYKCFACERIFIRQSMYTKHLSKGKCYVNACDVCAATFATNSDFYEHYTVEHNNRAVCKFCFHTLNNVRNLKEHIKRHFDLFSFSCHECDKGFYTKREFNSHYRNRHEGFKESCNICHEEFKDQLLLANHMDRHHKNNFLILD